MCSQFLLRGLYKSATMDTMNIETTDTVKQIHQEINRLLQRIEGFVSDISLLTVICIYRVMSSGYSGRCHCCYRQWRYGVDEKGKLSISSATTAEEETRLRLYYFVNCTGTRAIGPCFALILMRQQFIKSGPEKVIQQVIVDDFEGVQFRLLSCSCFPVSISQ